VKQRGPGIVTWLEVKWSVAEGWTGLSLEDGWVALPLGPPIETLRRMTG